MKISFDMFYGILISDGSVTGDKSRPCISIKYRDYNVGFLNAIQESFGGKVYGPYDSGSKLAKGPICVYVLRGKALKAMVEKLNLIEGPSPYFNERFKNWKEKYGL